MIEKHYSPPLVNSLNLHVSTEQKLSNSGGHLRSHPSTAVILGFAQLEWRRNLSSCYYQASTSWKWIRVSLCNVDSRTFLYCFFSQSDQTSFGCKRFVGKHLLEGKEIRVLDVSERSTKNREGAR